MAFSVSARSLRLPVPGRSQRSDRKRRRTQGGSKMKRYEGWTGIAALVVAALLAAPSLAGAKDDPAKYGQRLIEAKRVFQELMSAPDKKVPQKLLDNAKCIVVIPD